MENNVFVKTFSPPPINKKEIYRYAGIKDADETIEKLTKACISEAEDCLSFKVCFNEVNVKTENGETDFGFAKIKSFDLAKNLENCSKAIVFAATAGLGIDRLIMKYENLSPAKAVILQALGTERVEALCDEFCAEISEKYGKIRPRFSVGYGDAPLEAQRDIFRLLDCPRKIGITLGENLLMTPSKSVTAFIGVEK